MKREKNLTELGSESILSEMEKLSVYGGHGSCCDDGANNECSNKHCPCIIYKEKICGE